MTPLVENILYLTFLVCLSVTDEIACANVHFGSWINTDLFDGMAIISGCKMGSSFEDCDNGLMQLAVDLGASSFQVVLATCTGLPSI